MTCRVRWPHVHFAHRNPCRCDQRRTVVFLRGELPAKGDLGVNIFKARNVSEYNPSCVVTVCGEHPGPKADKSPAKSGKSELLH